ncbi:MAG: hypothetical protein KF760_09110 [Candidatus Eremiobacteraeota bacterium]|nr:hypothetical protein [Candidatus Eremiobacteraeota bacterium]MCW5869262.1 hypothetical protein [Candidatus Eremiobacteraeota bacterium]
MSGKPFISPLDVYVSAANASEEAKSLERKGKPDKPARTRKAPLLSPEAKSSKSKSKTRPDKETAPTPPPAEFGIFRCQVCDYRVTILPGSAKPPGGWRCPIDFASLILVSANY